jgi:carboxyvinyl-carboxyphosphonate phosphorylmutase
LNDKGEINLGTLAVLRELLNNKEILIAPGAYDAASAKIIEQVGFKAVYMTGYGTSASYLGQPDVGLMTMSEMVNRVGALTSVVNIPVICDGDTGFGNVVNVARTVFEYERAGAAAIQLEDQVSPKKCGHMLGRQVIPMEEMVAKIKIAVKSRKNKDFLIIARTDARTVHGLEEAITRGKAYEAAGADIIFIESPETIEEMKIITANFNVPTLANMIEHGRTPLLTAKELQDMGYGMVIFPVANIYAAAKAVKNTMEELLRTGTTAGCIPNMIAFPEFNDIIGLPRIQAIENGDAHGRIIEK